MSFFLINTGGLATVAFLLLWLWRQTHEVMSCANIFSASFGLPVIGSQVWCRLTESIYQPTPQTVALLYAGWIAFLLGMAITVRRVRHPRSSVTRFMPVGRHARLVLIALILLHVSYTIAAIHSTGLVSIFQAGQLGIIDSFAANRLSGSQNPSSGVGWYLEAWHVGFIYYLPLALFLYRQGQISRKILLFVWAFAGVLSLVLFSRVQFFMLLIFGLMSWVVLFKPSGGKIARTAGLLLCGAVALFVGMQTVLAQVDVGNKTQLSDQLEAYTVSSALAFQEMLNGGYHEANPHHALYVGTGIYYLLGKLSLLNPAEYPIGFRAFVFVPYATNVYTFLDVFALDFGTTGVILGPLLMGMGMGWIYNRVRARTTYPLMLIYILCAYTCSIANLANFLFTLPIPIFLGTILLLRPLVLPDTRRQRLILSPAQSATTWA